ncbi:hypothetical protein OSB04_017064 [Centaurea solstitialis]|uniref:Integrase catalytic domain-containing protein n=1 Tax=Centaurea solstitialis TaxID=347529 RepID=A0AA38T278_9ASTR|nr:hypothetical protein OSB04_017064 [Centaurea solstitialis]
MDTQETVLVSKVPMLKPNEFDMWKIRIRQYMLLTDYGMWEVVENGPDAKSLWTALEKRFSGTKSTKRNQKAILKQQYENFTSLKNESMTQTFDRFNKLIGELATVDVKMDKDDVNRKFLRSLGEEWTIYTVSFRQGDALEDKELEDLYNDLRIFEAEVEKKKRPIGYSHNTALLSSENPSSFNTTAFTNTTATYNTTANETVSNINSCTSQETNDDTILEAFLASNVKSSLINDDLDQINADDLEEMDIKWQMAMLTMRMKDLLEELGETTLMSKEEIKLDLINQSDHVEEAVQNQALMAEIKEIEIPSEVSSKLCSDSCLETVKKYRDHNQTMSDSIKKLEIDRREYVKIIDNLEDEIKSYKANELQFEYDYNYWKWEKKEYERKLSKVREELECAKKELTAAKDDLEKFSKSSKALESIIKAQVHDDLKRGIGYNNTPPPYNQNYIPPTTDLLDRMDREELKEGLDRVDPVDTEEESDEKSTTETIPDDNHLLTNEKGENRPKPCFICCKTNHLARDCYFNPINQRNSFQTRRFVPTNRRVVPKQNRSSQPKRKVQKKKVDNKTVKLVTKWVPKASLSNTTASTSSGNDSVTSDSSGNSYKEIKVNTATSNNNSGNSNTVSTATPSIRKPIITKYSSHEIPNKDYLLKLNRLTESNQGRRSSLWHVDSGCSRHMTGIMSLLEDFKKFEGGHVAFGDNPTGGKISGKGKVSKGKMTFDDVYYVEQLRYNLLSIDESQVMLRTPRKDNVYCLDIEMLLLYHPLNCLFSKASVSESSLWHRRMCHMNFKNMNLLVKNNLVRGLPAKEFSCDDHCVACLKGKQHKSSHKSKKVNTISSPLQLLHMDLFGPTNVMSIGKKSYCLVIVDDYSRVENKTNLRVKVIRSDNGTEFKNADLNSFCEEKGIERQYSAHRTPQQNGVAERRNRTLIEAARTMLADSKLPITFWAEAVNTACYVQNRVLIVKSKGKTPYELFEKKKPYIGFLKPFGCPCTILDTKTHLGKFDSKSDDGFLVGYYTQSKALRVFNNSTRIIEESDNVKCNENTPNIPGKSNDGCTTAELTSEEQKSNARGVMINIWGNFLSENIEGIPVQMRDLNGIRTRKESSTYSGNRRHSVSYDNKEAKQIPSQSTLEYDLSFSISDRTKEGHDAMKDLSWIEAMQEELLQFVLQHVWDLLPELKPSGYSWPLHLTKAFKVYQMDAKSAFLYGTIDEEEFEELMHKKFKMSSMGELTFFLGLQAKGVSSTCSQKDIKYLKGQPRLGLWYPNDSSFDLVAYTDSDMEEQIWIESLHQEDVSSWEEDWSHGSARNRPLIKCKTMVLSFLQTPIYIDNNSAISIVNNPVKHSKTKHIEIKYHFIRDCNEKKLIQVLKVHTDDQYADLFTKAFDQRSDNTYVYRMSQVQLCLYFTIMEAFLRMGYTGSRTSLKYLKELTDVPMDGDTYQSSALGNKVFSNMQRPAPGSNDTFTPLFSTMMRVNHPQGEASGLQPSQSSIPTDDLPPPTTDTLPQSLDSTPTPALKRYIRKNRGAPSSSGSKPQDPKVPSKEKDGHVVGEAQTTDVAQVIHKGIDGRPGNHCKDLKAHDGNFQIHEEKHKSHEERLDILEKIVDVQNQLIKNKDAMLEELIKKINSQGALMASMRLKLSALQKRYFTLVSFTKGEKRSKVKGEYKKKEKTIEDTEVVNEPAVDAVNDELMVEKEAEAKGESEKVMETGPEKEIGAKADLEVNEDEKKSEMIDPKDKGKKIVEEVEYESDDDEEMGFKPVVDPVTEGILSDALIQQIEEGEEKKRKEDLAAIAEQDRLAAEKLQEQLDQEEPVVIKKKPLKKTTKKATPKAVTEKRRIMVRYLSGALGKPV